MGRLLSEAWRSDREGRGRGPRRPAGLPTLASLALALGGLAGGPAAGAAALDIGIEKGGRARPVLDIKNRCTQTVKWKLELENLGRAASIPIRQPLVIPPGGTREFEVSFDASRTGKKKLSGKLVAKCTNCARGCTPHRFETPIRVTIVDLGRFEKGAAAFVERAGLEIQPVGLRLVDPRGHPSRLRKIGPAELERAATRLLRSAASAGRTLAFAQGSAAALAPVDGLADELIRARLVRAGQFLAEVDWRHENGESFTTLAAVGENGEPSFEPALYFGAVERVEPPERRAGAGYALAEASEQKSVGPWIWELENYWGLCARFEWSVEVEAQKCRIEDPRYHVDRDADSHCLLWEITKKERDETPWCRRNPQCSTRCQTDGGVGEDCIDWTVDFEIEKGPGGIFGSHSKQESGRLCALSGVDDAGEDAGAPGSSLARPATRVAGLGPPTAGGCE